MLPGHLVDASGRGIFYPSMDLDQESTNLDPVGDMGVRYGEPMLHNVTQPYQGPVGPADTCTRVPMGVSNYGDSVASTGPDQDPHSICEKPPQAVTIAALRAGPQADTPRANTAKKPFKCDQCPKSYRRHGGLNRHKKDKHLAKLKCGHCCEFYWSAGRQYAYTDHLSSAHPEALNFPSPAASDAGPRSTIPWSDKPGHWRRLGRNH
ncbi:hypothetical protein BC834DRAFT_425438 [Gloeopeniophorella convolvens]|nr:hypothetical protein BC834DRAFT_425438 [Gloeopeniophorella convolvens]